jgi:uncharacterized protein YkwD
MIQSHRASDPAQRPAAGFPLVRIVLAAVLALALFGGAAYGGSRLLASNDESSPPPAAAGDAPPPAAAPGGEESPGAFPSDSGSPGGASSTAPTTASSIKAATSSATKKPTQNSGGNGNVEAAGPTAEVLRIVNSERAKAGCGALTADNRLNAAAQAHSADMAAKDYFSHTSQNGDEMADRIDATGYKWRSIGENIAKGQATPASVMEAWMNSSGHRANILNCGFRNIGIGLAYDGRSPVWTQDFGTPR